MNEVMKWEAASLSVITPVLGCSLNPHSCALMASIEGLLWVWKCPTFITGHQSIQHLSIAKGCTSASPQLFSLTVKLPGQAMDLILGLLNSHGIFSSLHSSSIFFSFFPFVCCPFTSFFHVLLTLSSLCLSLYMS